MQQDKELNIPFVVAALIAGACLLFLVCRPADPNAELARTTREAVQLARESGSSAESAALWAGRFRLLAVAAGLLVPVLVACLVWRWSARSDLDPTEVIEVVERYQLPKRARLASEELQAKHTEGLPSKNADNPTA
jgi:hypothetical protein